MELNLLYLLKELMAYPKKHSADEVVLHIIALVVNFIRFLLCFDDVRK